MSFLSHARDLNLSAAFFFDKNLLSLEVSIGKPLLYVKEILPQNVVLDTDAMQGVSRDISPYEKSAAVRHSRTIVLLSRGICTVFISI